MATTSPDRILSLDIIRGIAVMGIFSVNIVGMGMIERAYFYPPDYGFDAAYDRIMWAANFIVVDGRFRSLFSILFGASTVLVCERAIASGKAAWKVHYPRMFALLAFGLAHFYFLWWGDILSNYALVGMIAFAFWRMPVKALLPVALVALAFMYVPAVGFGMYQTVQADIATSADATPEQREEAMQLISDAEPPTQEELDAAEAGNSTLPAHLNHVLETQPLRPFASVPGYGLETLGLMLLGMIGYKSGFLTGAWERKSYVKIAVFCGGGTLLFHSFAAWMILRANFDPWVYSPWDRMFVFPLHPVAAFGYAAFIILVVKQSSWIGQRFAAVGRAAFTNYLGSTIIGILLFYDHGLDLYGQLSRGELWLFAPLVWAIMLLWSKPWLDRYRYGPFEWAWRSLARWHWEPMRRVAANPA